MIETVRTVSWSGGEADPEPLLTREWLVTNGLGGYASGTVGNAPTRRYHGLLIAALPAPHGRTLLLGGLAERFSTPDGRTFDLSSEERVGGRIMLRTARHLEEFRLEDGMPVWRYRLGGAEGSPGSVCIERQVFMPHGQNTTVVQYRLIEGQGPVCLYLRPWVCFRGHDAPVSTPLQGPFTLTARDGRYELAGTGNLPPLRMQLFAERPAFTIEHEVLREVLYRIEESRGYEHSGDVWSPGEFRADLSVGHPMYLVATAEPWETIDALTPTEVLELERERRRRLVSMAHPAARRGIAAEMVLAADQFLIDPSVSRAVDAARAHAAGYEARSVIAGYHWFTDWGRDTMISLEGLTLMTGRAVEAGYILRTFAQYVRDGLIPNFFPDGVNDGLYHTADATLWFFHATERYVEHTGDRAILDALVPVMLDIVQHHIRGTRFGIGVDPTDGLLRQGAIGYQLTWMDAKVGDWVVTPRRGKAVEINALWYNALRVLERFLREMGGQDDAARLEHTALQAREAFHKRFWYEAGGYLYDVVDGEPGNDEACRPNQLLAIALPHPILDPQYWQAVLDVVAKRLLTPVGLRSLDPAHRDYKSRYFGDLRARDAAYHQGTVWAWLIGPYVDAWLKVHPGDLEGARQALMGLLPHLGEACIGSVSEVFDAEPPFTARGCIAQAWSVAELLRCWVLTERERE